MTDRADVFETGFVFPEQVAGSNCLWSAAGRNPMRTAGSGSLILLQCINITVAHMWMLTVCCPRVNWCLCTYQGNKLCGLSSAWYLQQPEIFFLQIITEDVLWLRLNLRQRLVPTVRLHLLRQ